ncbi:MAG: transglycosylase SLT domain-containing protein [Deltaproteobacteria bacterium]|nr:transglycosylase SLT domain-containing protein [Deltaproteobacteria bacterium]
MGPKHRISVRRCATDRALGTLFFLICLVLPASTSYGEVPEALRYCPVYQLPEKLDLCGEPVPLSNPDVWERLDREFLVAVYDHAQVFLWLRRSSRFFPLIEKELRARSLPDDIKYLAVAESALIPQIRSYKGALGCWQFIKPTAERYGLRSNVLFEDRLDFERATQAALSYLSDLHEQFDSWPLAMAAYNCGEQRIEKEINEQGEKNYWRLDLPPETERYIFRILAAKLILSDPEKYGYCLLDPRAQYEPVEWEKVQVNFDESVHIRTVAQACGTYFKAIKDLNPEIKGYYFPQGTHEIRIPKGSGKDFAKFYREYKKEAREEKYQVHVVREGENLTMIADRFGVSVDSLRKWNGLSKNVIRPGQKLRVY